VEKEIRGEFADIDVEVSEGAHGEFSIYLDDRLIFTKSGGSCCADRFPRPGEINDMIRRLRS
jgi:hypothetical protein